MSTTLRHPGRRLRRGEQTERNTTDTTIAWEGAALASREQNLPFGPYNAPVLIAHHNEDNGCVLLYGSEEAIGDRIPETYNVYRLPAGTRCDVKHIRQGHGGCRQTIVQEFLSTKQTQANPDPPPPQQLCLCEENVLTCDIGDTPDCSGTGECTLVDLDKK